MSSPPSDVESEQPVTPEPRAPRKRKRSQGGRKSSGRKDKKKRKKELLIVQKKYDETFRFDDWIPIQSIEHDAAFHDEPNQEHSEQARLRRLDHDDLMNLDEDGPRAPSPGLPDPMDDSPVMKEETMEEARARTSLEEKIKAVRAKEKKARLKAEQGAAKPPPSPTKRQERHETPDEEQPKISILDVPTEVRENIFRQLLVADKSIPVYAGWKKLYKPRPSRNGLERHLENEKLLHKLEPAVLYVCKQFYAEGKRILYSENTFLYRLRDATNEIRNVEEMNNDIEDRNEDEADQTDGEDAYDAADDEDGSAYEGDDGGRDVAAAAGGDEDGDQLADHEQLTNGEEQFDDDPDYEDDAETALGPQRRTRWKKKLVVEDWQLDIDNVKPLIRHIVVEAEHNRFSRGQMENMARALKVFIPEDVKDKAQHVDARPNIHTITIRVAPQLIGDDVFSFVNFFDTDSPIIVAIKEIQCQHLRVEIKRQFLTPMGEEAPTKLYRLDMRHYRMARRAEAGLPDPWHKNKALKKYRLDSAAATVRLVDNLHKIVLARCEADGPRKLVFDAEVNALFWVWEDAQDDDAEQ